PPRWRSLLDRALLGRANPSDLDYDGRFDSPRAPYPPARPYDDEPMYPSNGTSPVDAPPRSAGPPRPGPMVDYQSRPSDPADHMVQVLRQAIPTPKVPAFANPKGGVHKTTATVLTAATIGSVRGKGVIAWDDNELRGTLGLRAGSARHARTIRHLIADLALVEINGGGALTERLDDYLRHAADGPSDVLAGGENPPLGHRLAPSTLA